MRTTFQYVLVEQSGAVLTITMNRPEVLNAFNETMKDELIEAVEAAAEAEAVHCVVLTGAGRAFGSGQDVTSFIQLHKSNEPAVVSQGLDKYHRIIRALRTMPKPTLAAVHGVAAGASCNLALACDMRIAADNARFIEAFARIGLVPDAGGAFFLPRLVGLSKALELSMLADEVNGPEAERIGLVNKCVPLADLKSETSALAQRLAKGPTRTYGLIKELMYKSFESDLETTFGLEGELQEIAFSTADHREGVSAFLQKRPPEYSGR